VHELIGCRVVDQHGTDRGLVRAVQDNPAADLLVLEDDTLVPVVFVLDGPRDGILRVEVPEGLFDL
jgi:ribosomal 30S subunit maturation factor RimM